MNPPILDDVAAVMRALAAGRKPELRVCAWCGRVHDEAADRWVEACPMRGVLLTHGMCPGCSAEFLSAPPLAGGAA